MYVVIEYDTIARYVGRDIVHNNMVRIVSTYIHNINSSMVESREYSTLSLLFYTADVHIIL